MRLLIWLILILILLWTLQMLAGMMDIALLTANANQLRFLITYNTETKTFYISTGLIVLSLIIQVLVGMALIFKVSLFYIILFILHKTHNYWVILHSLPSKMKQRQMKKRGKRNQADKTGDFLVSGVFLVTVINVLAASFTTTSSNITTSAPVSTNAVLHHHIYSSTLQPTL